MPYNNLQVLQVLFYLDHQKIEDNIKKCSNYADTGTITTF